MFAQSLSKGSEEAQIALQRLTTFLEAEGTSGRISPALQKKVLGTFNFDRNAKLNLRLMVTFFFSFLSLDVLLVALSDCLAENPQLVAAARLSLADTSQLPKQLHKH